MPSWKELLEQYAEPDGVYLDALSGAAGTAPPLGSPSNPVSNLADAIIIAAALKTPILRLRNPIDVWTAAAAMQNYLIIGPGKSTPGYLTRNGQSFLGTVFKDMYVQGTGTGTNRMIDCSVNGTDGGGEFHRCSVYNYILGASAGVVFDDCVFYTYLNLAGDAGGLIHSISGSGVVEIRNLTAASTLNIYAKGLNLTIAVTCTAGTINIYGDARVTNNAGGATVNDYTARSLLLDSTYGLSALETLVDDLETRLTAARAGYLDELAAANIPTDVDDLKTSRDRQLFSMDFWSPPQEEVTITNAAATKTLPSVTVGDLPSGATVVRAIALLKFRAVENTNVAANKLSGATVAATSQVIQVRTDAPGTWRDAIKFVDDQFGLAASTREGGDVLIGDTDIAVEVTANDIYEFQGLLMLADVSALNWNDLQCGLRIWYSV